MTIKKILWLLAPIFIGLIWLTSAPASAVTISPAIPGMTTAATSSTPPGVFVGGFYNFALMIGGVLAFGAIVYGGILYAASAGNPSKQSEGKELVKGALFGLLLLAGAYLILYTVNPNLVNLALPTLSAVNIAAPAGGGGNGAVGAGVGGCSTPCTGGTTCQGIGGGVYDCEPPATLVPPVGNLPGSGVGGCSTPCTGGTTCQGIGGGVYDCEPPATLVPPVGNLPGSGVGGCSTPCTGGTTCQGIGGGVYVCQ